MKTNTCYFFYMICFLMSGESDLSVRKKTEISNFDIVLPSTNYVEQLGADAKKSSHRNLSNEFCDLMDSIACLPPNDLRSPRKVWYLLAKRTSVTDLE